MPAKLNLDSSNIYQNFLQHWQGFFSPKEKSKIAVAFSGGSDSLALLLLVKYWAEKQGAVTALIVNHQLRPHMQEELAEISSFLAKEQINHEILTWQPPKTKANLQATARTARYNLLTKWCKNNNYYHLAFAHQQDDQVENFHLRLYHGSGPHGLAKIKTETAWNGIRILRPLLDISKDELQTFLLNHGYSWWEDNSNQLPIYQRNKVRQQITKLSQEEVTAVLFTQRNLSLLASYLDSEKLKFMAKHLTISELGNAKLDYQKILQLDWQVQRLILSEILQIISGNRESIREHSLEQLSIDIRNKTKSTLHGVIISYHHDEILFWREEGMIKEPELIEIQGDYYWDQRFFITNPKKLSLKLIKLNHRNWQQYVKGAPNLKEIKLKRSHIFTLPLIITLENQLLIPHIYNNKAYDFNVKFMPCRHSI